MTGLDDAAAAYGRGDYVVAERLCRSVLESRPRDFDALHMMAVLLARRGRQAEALAHYDRAATVRPDQPELLNNRGILLKNMKRLDEALANYDRALALRPDYAKAHYNRAGVLYAANRHADARAAYERTLAAAPDHAAARFGLCMAELPTLYSDAAEIPARRAAYAARLDALIADAAADAGLRRRLAAAIGAHQPYYLAYQGHADRDLQARYGALLGRLAREAYDAAPLPPPPAPDEPVRVGIVSGFFRMHSNWKQPISGWLSQLDRRRFRLFGYHTGGVSDANTATAAKACARFVQGLSSVPHWRSAILADAPHVLIYPEIGMDPVVPALAAQRLAPTQCVFWGHPETSGLPTVDYFLTSALMEPPDGDAHYTESLVRLPNLSIYYEPPETATAATPRAALGLRSGATVYWCGQTVAKYLPQHDGVLARIAEQAGDCQFAFVTPADRRQGSDLLRRRLTQAFANAGLDGRDRCVFLPRMTMADYGAAMGACDVFLDTIGWSGGNTTLESLAWDLPVVTLPGPLMRSRHSAAILEMIGVTETMARSIDGYVGLAVRLARDTGWRAQIRGKMAALKHRVYRDRSAITALERWLENVTRTSKVAQ